jgi:hypothetical protein
MKTYLKVLASTIIGLWLIVSFVSLTPNVFTWSVSGRLVFLIAGVVGSIFALTFLEAMRNEK